MSHTEQMREARKIADEIDANVLAVANRQMKPGAFPLDVVCKAASLLRTLTAPAAEVPKQSTRLRAAAVPEGWKLVPVEPTPEMRKAAADAWLDCGSKMILNKAAAAVKAAIQVSREPS